MAEAYLLSLVGLLLQISVPDIKRIYVRDNLLSVSLPVILINIRLSFCLIPTLMWLPDS